MPQTGPFIAQPSVPPITATPRPHQLTAPPSVWLLKCWHRSNPSFPCFALACNVDSLASHVSSALRCTLNLPVLLRSHYHPHPNRLSLPWRLFQLISSVALLVAVPARLPSVPHRATREFFKNLNRLSSLSCLSSLMASHYS